MRRKRIVGEINLCLNDKCYNTTVKEHTDNITTSSSICPYCGEVMMRHFIWQGVKFKGEIHWQV